MSNDNSYLLFQNAEIRLSVTLEGFDTNNQHIKHGFHVHEGDDIEEACQNAGEHYNPTNNTHGSLTSSIRYRNTAGSF